MRLTLFSLLAATLTLTSASPNTPPVQEALADVGQQKAPGPRTGYYCATDAQSQLFNITEFTFGPYAPTLASDATITLTGHCPSHPNLAQSTFHIWASPAAGGKNVFRYESAFTQFPQSMIKQDGKDFKTLQPGLMAVEPSISVKRWLRREGLWRVHLEARVKRAAGEEGEGDAVLFCVEFVVLVDGHREGGNALWLE